jgi:hypothetical protein
MMFVDDSYIYAFTLGSRFITISIAGGRKRLLPKRCMGVTDATCLARTRRTRRTYRWRRW